MEEHKQVYIAAPFFNDEQKHILKTIETMLEVAEVGYYSPMRECMFVPGETKAEDILRDNVDAILKADYLIAVTNGKDMGTLFECGWAFANDIPIIYVWLNPPPEGKFNLMLSASAISVCTTYSEIDNAIHLIALKADVGDHMPKYEGQLE